MIKHFLRKTALSSICAALLLLYGTAFSADNIRFCGGPSGGTFTVYANAIANLMRKNYVGVTAVPTNGGIDNIRAVDRGDADFGVTYAEDVYSAVTGKTDGDNKVYSNVRVIGPLYQASIIIAVKSSSGIFSLRDLAGKKIGVGDIGSGSAVSVRRVLQPAGLYDKVTKYYIGYRAAVPAFNQGAVDAIWIYSGTPNPTITELCRRGGIRLIPINTKTDIRHNLPGFYKPNMIPAKTYSGIGKPLLTISGSAVWIAGANVKDSDVKTFMSAVYSGKNLNYLKSQNAPVSADGLNGVLQLSLPMHPAAKAFWKASGKIQ